MSLSVPHLSKRIFAQPYLGDCRKNLQHARSSGSRCDVTIMLVHQALRAARRYCTRAITSTHPLLIRTHTHTHALYRSMTPRHPRRAYPILSSKWMRYAAPVRLQPQLLTIRTLAIASVRGGRHGFDRVWSLTTQAIGSGSHYYLHLRPPRPLFTCFDHSPRCVPTPPPLCALSCAHAPLSAASPVKPPPTDQPRGHSSRDSLHFRRRSVEMEPAPSTQVRRRHRASDQ